MKRSNSEMVTIEDDRVHCSLIIAGLGSPPTVESSDVDYI